MEKIIFSTMDTRCVSNLNLKLVEDRSEFQQDSSRCPQTSVKLIYDQEKHSEGQGM